ncbi:hypothetical protein C8Q77DRAFT_1074483 [Trametes polyzona]|nr:hypothetical protein C8Q77DRAFT_1074483 [Trametes polyzona]
MACPHTPVDQTSNSIHHRRGNQRANTRTAVDEEYSDLPALAGLWNSALSAVRLPPEILVEIIFCTRRSDDQPTRLYREKWPRFRLVCCHWNEVVCSTPLLWRDIHVFRTSSWLSISLLRSQGALVDLTFHDNRFPLEALAHVLSPHLNHTRSINLQDTIGPPWISQLQRLFAHPMDALETLELCPSVRGQGLVNLSALNVQHPKIHTLVFSGVVVPLNLCTITNLRILKIRGCHSSLAPNQLLDVLRSNPRLQSLELAGFLNALGGNWVPHSTLSSHPPVLLTALNELSLSRHLCDVTAAFLTYLRLPASATIWIEGVLGAAMLGSDPTGALSSLVPPASILGEVFSVHPQVDSAVVQVKENACNAYRAFGANVTAGRYPDLSLSLSVVTPLLHWSRALPMSVRGLLDIFGGCALTSLQICGDLDPLKTSHWASVLRAFPTLEDIRIFGEGYTIGLWHALGPPPSEAHSSRGTHARGVLGRKLRTIGYDDGIEVSDKFLDTLVDTLTWRAERGARLRSLRLIIRPDPEIVARATVDRCRTALEALVDQLSFITDR